MPFHPTGMDRGGAHRRARRAMRLRDLDRALAGGRQTGSDTHGDITVIPTHGVRHLGGDRSHRLGPRRRAGLRARLERGNRTHPLASIRDRWNSGRQAAPGGKDSCREPGENGHERNQNTCAGSRWLRSLAYPPRHLPGPIPDPRCQARPSPAPSCRQAPCLEGRLRRWRVGPAGTRICSVDDRVMLRAGPQNTERRDDANHPGRR